MITFGLIIQYSDIKQRNNVAEMGYNYIALHHLILLFFMWKESIFEIEQKWSLNSVI